MRAKPNPTPQPTTAPDPEAQLFGRLVARVLSWPCPSCGKPWPCTCFDEPPAQPTTAQPSEAAK